MLPRTIELKIPCEPGYEKVAMRAAGETAALAGVPPARVLDLQTAVSEACINAMEHGNRNDHGTKILIAVTLEADRLAVDVADEGRSGPPPADVAEPDVGAQIEGHLPVGGMGLFVIKALVDEADFVEPVLGSGNQFRMVIHLEPGSGDESEGAQ
mgnify:CR=1 FL=1